jgi:hypothetical protein
MAPDSLFALIDAVRAEFGVRTGRNEWLNIATVGDLHEHLARVLRASSPEARAALWVRVAATVAGVTGAAPEALRPESGFDAEEGGATPASRPAS